IIGVAVALAAEIKPGLRILMDEQWRERTDVADAVIFKRRTFPSIPGLWFQGMHWRSQPQQIHHHHFAVVVPAIGQEAALRGPAVWQQRRILGEPGPIDATVNAVSEVGDFGMLTKVLAAG